MVGPVKSGEITATGDTLIGQASGRRVSSWLIHFSDNSSTTASITIRGKAADRSAGAYGMVAMGYKDMATSAVDTSAITTASLPKAVLVDSAGMEIVLDTTAIAAGGVRYTAVPLLG